MTSVKEKAAAKINLYLDVVGKRPDGFHDIKSIMHTVDLSDELTVSASPAKENDIKLFVSGVELLPVDEKNLAVRAARLYVERAGINAKIRIRLDKTIPVSAGLAGGSADAAATLRALNRLYGHFTERALAELAAELGSDVPFCLVRGTALCEGRGEIITRLPSPEKMYFVIAVANERVSTPEAYGALDKLYSDFDGSVLSSGGELLAAQLSKIADGKINPSALYNAFEDVVLPECDGARRIKSRLVSLGAMSALMSGSGPSVFGIFASAEQARTAAEKLAEEGVRAYFAASL